MRNRPKTASGSDVRSRWIVIALVATTVFLCAAHFDPKLHTGGDNALYILLSESIRTVGDGYSTTIEPGPAVPHTLVPPGYPVLLAAVGALFGRNIVLLKLLSLALIAGTAWIFCLFVRDRARNREGPYPHLLLALAFAVSPLLIDYSHWILSEAPFAFFVMLSLFLLQRDSGEREDRTFWLALLAAVASFYVRSVGALLLVAASAGYLVRRQWRKFLVHGVVGVALTIPWLIRNRLLTGTTSSYLEQFSVANIYDPEAGTLDLMGRVERVLDNAWFYATRELPRALVGSDSSWSTHPLVDAVAIVVCVLAIVGLVQALRRRPGALEFFFVLTFAAITMFQSVANDVRYLVPLLPLILVYAIEGALSVAEAARRRVPRLRVLPAALAGTLVGVALLSASARIPRNVDMLSRYSAGDPYADYHPVWRHFFEAAAYVRGATPEDAVVTVRKPRLFRFLTDRRTRVFPFTTERDSVLSVVLSTDYVVIDQVSRATTALYLVPVIEENRDRFRCEYRSEQPYTYVCAVLDTPP
ncbi:MAG: hypothetical protein F4139_10275 [Gemmatimonadetes bacterium]|nr:hypothetical protein [Gemmatimonadota bacterium]MYA63642.1 hypothetical protein [Gemmatimonadota bacterium]MYB98142.1 hypothetical protein [Gemmatimonadota bacterium]MYH53322.1 hypothetical protein [Gemmatimonadota bacterium]MYI46025.1 hypothetical protein [Gemmatimonadota bacterium]